MSSSTSALMGTLDAISFWLNQIIFPIQIIFGTFGNALNILIFTRRSLRTNSCSLYFLASSINNLFVIYFGLFTRYLSLNWNIDPTNTNTALCKLRIFFVYVSLSIVLWLTVLASMDRFFCSSSKLTYRRMSRLPIARKIIIGTILFIFLIHLHMLVFYQADQGDCSSFQDDYGIFFDFFFFIVSCILPIICMIVFGLLIILNVRKSRNRIDPQGNNAQNQRLKSNDHQLMLMLSIQVMITIFISVPFAFTNLYITIFVSVLQYDLSLYTIILLSFTGNLSRILYFFNPVIGFYIYTLSSRKFRRELKHCFYNGCRFIFIKLHLLQHLPISIQQVFNNEDQMDLNDQSLTQIRRRNNNCTIQNQTATAAF